MAAPDMKNIVDTACSTAEDFSKIYYDKMDNKRHTIAKMYLDTAVLSWNGNRVDGATKIQEFLLDKIPIKTVHQVHSLDAQPVASAVVGNQTTIMVLVAGAVQYQDLRPKPFQQTFLLTAQGEHWKIGTDTFRHQELFKPRA